MRAMRVMRVEEENGSHIEPKLEQCWGRLKKLEWHAGVMTIDGGIPISVGRSDYSTRIGGVWIPNPGYFDVSVGNSSTGPFDFDAAWTFIAGVGTGSRESRDSRP